MKSRGRSIANQTLNTLRLCALVRNGFPPLVGRELGGWLHGIAPLCRLVSAIPSRPGSNQGTREPHV